MNDKPAEPPKAYEESTLFDASLYLDKTAFEELNVFNRDSSSLQILETSGVLPGVELIDSEAKPPATMNGRPDGADIVAIKQGDEVSGQPQRTELALAESGRRVSVEEVESFPAKKITYDNGTQRYEFEDGETVESRKNGLVIVEKSDHRIQMHLPGGEMLERQPQYLVDKQPQTPTETRVYDDGTVNYRYSDGTVEAIQPNGTHAYRYSDGSGSVLYPDGTFLNVDKDGNKYWALNDGTFVTKDKNGHWTVEDKDGDKVPASSRRYRSAIKRAVGKH